MTLLTTNRLQLRNLRKTDAAEIFSYRNCDTCARYQRWDDTSLAAIEQMIEDHKNDSFPALKPEQRFAISLSETYFIGELAVFFSVNDRCFTIGITICPQAQRQGFATEILSEVTRQLRNHFPAADIVALIDPENTASIRLFEKLGFIQECYAESIHSYVYTILGAVASN